MIQDQTRLARVSGRDGQVVWDIPLVERKGKVLPTIPSLPWQFGDCDGDGVLDVIMLFQVEGPSGPSLERRAVSLRHGKTLWSGVVAFHANSYPASLVSDLDGDGPAEVVVRDQATGSNQGAIELTVLDGRDGSTRWTWRGGAFVAAANQGPRDFCLANFGGKGQSDVCIIVQTADSRRRLVVLDANGKERAARDLKAGSSSTLTCADLDGDGRDALLFLDDDRLRAVRGNLKDLWSWPTHESVREVIRERAGQPSTVVLDSMVALDGATGRPRWAGDGTGSILDSGDSARPPRLLSESGDATICRMALHTTPDASFPPARGTPIEHALGADDPRWIRPLPWNNTITGIWLLVLAGVTALALFNLIIPATILKLATRRRFWSVRLLLALPVVVAIPMAILVAMRSDFAHEVDIVSWLERILALMVISLAGLPVICYAGMVGQSIVYQRWSRIALLAGLTALASFMIGICWWWWDMRGMPAIERYAWSGWYRVLIPGAYVVGSLAILRELLRLVTRLSRRKAAVSPAA
jgi:hypothetical protein